MQISEFDQSVRWWALGVQDRSPTNAAQKVLMQYMGFDVEFCAD